MDAKELKYITNYTQDNTTRPVLYGFKRDKRNFGNITFVTISLFLPFVDFTLRFTGPILYRNVSEFFSSAVAVHAVFV